MNYLAPVTFLLMAGCGSIKPASRQEETSTRRADMLSPMRKVLGTIMYFGDGPEIDVPENGRVGDAIPLTVTTYGGGCILEDTTIVAVDSLSANISPYQRIPTRPATCTAELNINRRALLVTFAISGRATVKIYGRAVPADTAVAFLRSILVR